MHISTYCDCTCHGQAPHCGCFCAPCAFCHRPVRLIFLADHQNICRDTAAPIKLDPSIFEDAPAAGAGHGRVTPRG
jgi:hypothetical protein